MSKKSLDTLMAEERSRAETYERGMQAQELRAEEKRARDKEIADFDLAVEMGETESYEAYYTLIVPWSDTPTIWHPTSRDFCPLNRGCFWTQAAARAWAAEKLGGQPYTLRFVPFLNLSELRSQVQNTWLVREEVEL